MPERKFIVKKYSRFTEYGEIAANQGRSTVVRERYITNKGQEIKAGKL